MIPSLRRLFLSLSLLGGSAACVATPIPQPPDIALDVTKIRFELAGGYVVAVIGEAGAIEPGNFQLRITPVADPPSDVQIEIGASDVASDGSFSVLVLGQTTNFFYFEAIGPTGDTYFGTIQGDPPEEVDPGPDTDEDGSPDRIDCAPDDPTRQGSRC